MILCAYLMYGSDGRKLTLFVSSLVQVNAMCCLGTNDLRFVVFDLIILPVVGNITRVKYPCIATTRKTTPHSKK